MSEPAGQQPEWVTPGRCDFCPTRGALLYTARCACGRHEVGLNLCDDKHVDQLVEGEFGCRACAHDLPVGAQHFCVLTPVDAPPRVPDLDAVDAAASVTCPQCGMVSHNRNDVAHRYCGNCHQFHDQMLLS